MFFVIFEEKSPMKLNVVYRH